MATIGASERGAWRLGIHGPRNVGKTCYLAALYGFRTDGDGVAVSFVDSETIDYLADKWDRSLMKGQKPSPNPKGIPSELSCQLTVNRRVWQIALRDYAGELIERKGADEVAELRDETREWMRSCHAILLFLDVTEPEQEIRERQNELDLLLAELRLLAADGKTISRPLALVLTKWDNRPGFDVQQAKTAAETTKAKEFLKNDAIFGQISSVLEQSGDRVEVFPISAFGSHRDGHLPPLAGPQPFNTHAPLVWALQRSEDMVVGNAERDAGRLIVGRWWPRYAQAIQLLENTVSNYRISGGTPTHDRLDKMARAFRWTLWRRRIAAILVAILAGMSALSFWAYRDEQTQYNATISAFKNIAIGPAGLKPRVEQYLARFNPWMRFLGHENDVRKRWADFQDKASDKDFSNVQKFRQQHTSETDAERCLAKDTEYMDLWPGSKQAPQVGQWLAEDSTARETYQARVKHESEYQKLLEDVAALAKANKFTEVEEAYRRILAEYPESPYRKEIERRIGEMVAARDEHEWKEVVDFDQRNPNSFDETIKKAHQYLLKRDAKHRKDAEAMLTRTEARWDRVVYDDVCKQSRAGNDANAIEATWQKATAYLDGTQPRKHMEPEIKKWLAWFNNLQNEQDYSVVVRSMNIPKGSNLEPALSQPECRIHLSVNGQKHSTGWAYGMEPVYGETLGPYRFKWGQGVIDLKIEGYHPMWWTDFAHLHQTDDHFVIQCLNGPLAVQDRNGREVVVHLECGAAIQPTLPPYDDR